MSEFSKVKQSVGLVASLILCFTASFIGAVGSMNAPSFYGQLVQPTWAPAPWVFGPVWTALYTMMAVAAWLVWRKGGWSQQTKLLTIFMVQLILNALWSWIFFAWTSGGWAFFEIIALWLMIAFTIYSFWRESRVAALLLVPYLLWVGFAAYLNFTLWQMNPAILGG